MMAAVLHDATGREEGGESRHALKLRNGMGRVEMGSVNGTGDYSEEEEGFPVAASHSLIRISFKSTNFFVRQPDINCAERILSDYG